MGRYWFFASASKSVTGLQPGPGAAPEVQELFCGTLVAVRVLVAAMQGHETWWPGPSGALESWPASKDTAGNRSSQSNLACVRLSSVPLSMPWVGRHGKGRRDWRRFRLPAPHTECLSDMAGCDSSRGAPTQQRISS